MNITRRRFTQSILAAAAVPTATRAQSYPAKPVNIVVGYAAGGGVDAVLRTVAAPLVRCVIQFCTYPVVRASAALARVTLARMSEALAVQMNGLGLAL